MMTELDRFNNYSIESLKALVSNEYQLVQEIEETNGLILYILLLAEIKPAYSFFTNFVNEHTISFFEQFYPEVKWSKVLESPKYKTYLALDLKDLYSNDKTILANHFKNYDFNNVSDKEYKKIFNDLFLNSFPGQSDVSHKIADFTEVLKSFVPITEMESLFDFDFFDNYFLNFKTHNELTLKNSQIRNFIYSLNLKEPHHGGFIFCFKLYLIHVATNDLHRDNFIYRRLYAESVIAMARFQMFSIEPKFFHRIFPILIQTSSLAIVLENVGLFIDVKNHVFIDSLIKKCPSINLIITLICAMKINAAKAEIASKEWSMKMLINSLKGISKEDFTMLVKFTSFTFSKQGSFISNLQNDEVTPLSKDQYLNLFNNSEVFFEKITYSVLSQFDINEVLNLIGTVAKEWNMYFISGIERHLGEKAFSRFMIEQISKSKNISDLNFNLLKVGFSRVKFAKIILNKFPNEIEKMMREDILKEGFAFQMMRGEKESLESMIPIIANIDHPEMSFLKVKTFEPGINLIQNFTAKFLAIKDYKNFYFFIRLLKKHYRIENMLAKPWQNHLNQLSVTDILLNSKDVYFALIMNSLSKFGIEFHNVKKEDSLNVYEQLIPFFAEKEVPLAWLKNINLPLNVQEKLLPGIILRDYNKKINRAITSKMNPENLKESLVSYLDSFLLEEVPNKFQIAKLKNDFDPLFVNKHLKAYRANLPKLLKLLEDRPEYYVIVAICALPEMSGTLSNKLKHIALMKVGDIIKMNIKDILTLNFDKYFDIMEEQYVFINKFINWEIAFKGIFKLVKNLYWVSQCRANDVNASHIKSMIEYTFYRFKSLYSYSAKIDETAVNVNYAYFMEPSFFFLLQEGQNHKEKDDRANNFIIALLRHMKYEMGNSDKEIFSSFVKLTDSIASGKHYWRTNLYDFNTTDDVVLNVEKVNGLKQTYKQKNVMIEQILKQSLKDISESSDFRVVLLFEYIKRYRSKAINNNDILTKRNNRYYSTFITMSHFINSSGIFSENNLINDDKARTMLMGHLLTSEFKNIPLNLNKEEYLKNEKEDFKI